MKPDDPLLKILACPLDKGPLHLVPEGTGTGEALYNPRLHRRYPIVDGIPQLLPSSGEQVGEEEHEELLRRIGVPSGNAADAVSGGNGDHPVPSASDSGGVGSGAVHAVDGTRLEAPAPRTAP